MNLEAILITLIVCASGILHAQQKVKDFYYVEPETKNLPVFVRGHLESKKILLFVQGGGAENGIDFGRADYPKWRKTLEKQVAIAYFDQRGLNRNTKKIDTSKINDTQVLKDIIAIAESLREKYHAEIHLFGHSTGGVEVLKSFAAFPEKTLFIKSGIVFNAPVTSDFSPERYIRYRPLYLKNLAREFISQGKDTAYWEKARKWIVKTGSIATIEDSKQWNAYVDSAFQPVKRKIGLGMILKTIFARPYNPIGYLNNRDNKFVSDKLWNAEKERWNTGKQTVMWDVLPKIKHPVLLLTGRFDAVAVPEEQMDAHKLIENSQLVIIPDCTHESYIVQPERFNETILNYLYPNR